MLQGLSQHHGKQRVRQQLEAYCGLDTEGTLQILDALQGLAVKNLEYSWFRGIQTAWELDLEFPLHSQP
jgi:hypothetical protein